MKLIKTLKKQGGVSLLANYLKNGVFLTALGEIILLGKERVSLEILRLSIQLKMKKKLKRKYSKFLDDFESNYVSQKQSASKRVWICWFQGLENAPDIVKICYHSMVVGLPTKNVTLITRENLNQYVKLPSFISKKWKDGIISDTHMSDLIRLMLLSEYGGTWIDATVLCTMEESKIPAYFFESDLFFYQVLKPGKDGFSTYPSTWYISAKAHNKIIDATLFLCFKYWERENSLRDYFLLHHFMSIVLERYSEQWKKVIPRDNATPHELLLRLFDQYDPILWEAINEQSPFHKLSYKFEEKKISTNNTMYKKIFEIYGK